MYAEEEKLVECLKKVVYLGYRARKEGKIHRQTRADAAREVLSYSRQQIHCPADIVTELM